MKENLNITSHLILALTFCGAGCGIGGPGDDQDPDAAVGQDSSVDAALTDSSVGSDADAEVTTPEVQLITAQDLHDNETPFGMGQTFVDLRPLDEYQVSYIPRAKPIPMADLWDGQSLVNGGQELTNTAPVKELPLFFYHHAAEQSNVWAMAEAVLATGYEEIYVLDGGIEAWWAQHYYQDITMGGVELYHYGPIRTDEYIVDNMDSVSYAERHITGALNLDSELIYDTIDDVIINNGAALTSLVPCSATTIIFYCVNTGCSSSEHAALVAEQLSCYDNTTILHFPEGTELWENSGKPISCGSTPDGACP